MNSRRAHRGPLRTLAVALLVLASQGVARGAAQEQVLITEFMAANGRTLADRDRDFADWIELHNPGLLPVDLGGWFLTDKISDLKKWRFPSTLLPAGAYRVVFASGKDRRVSGEELHTNFKLDAFRGYLALVKPDGVTIASTFAPAYPRQLADLSYGLDLSGSVSLPVSTTTPRRVLVPTADPGGGWKAAEFDDSSWLTLTNAAGFSRHPHDADAAETSLRDQMLNQSASAFLRVPFDLSDPETDTLQLRMNFDDGFIAYLNGTEVARRNAPPGAVWKAAATAVHERAEPVLQTETFDGAAGAYSLAGLDAQTSPRVHAQPGERGGGFLRLVNGHRTNQVNAIGFPPATPDSWEVIEAGFDFRWRGEGEGAQRLAFLLLPVARYGAARGSVAFAEFRELRDPTLRGVLAVQVLRGGVNGQQALAVYWDGTRRAGFSLPQQSFGAGAFHRVHLRLEHRGPGSVLTVALTSPAGREPNRAFEAVPALFIEGLRPFPFRVEFAGRIGHWDQTIDLDEIRVCSFARNDRESEEFDLTPQRHLLRQGRNLLAIQGLNRSASDPTFLIVPELVAGRDPARRASLRYFPMPTPGAANEKGVPALAPPPVFSPRGGVFTNAVSLNLSSSTGVVRYTLDGSEPTAAAESYREPIAIVRSTQVRARTFVLGLAPGPTVSETFTLLDDSLAGFISNLPLVIINPFNQPIMIHTPSRASVRWIEAADGRAALLDPAAYDGQVSLNFRGFTSLRQPKKSLTIRLLDDNNDKVKAPLLGLPKESDWVLYAPYSDKTLLRDVLAYELSNQMGRYAPRTRFVEVFLDRSEGRLGRRDYAGVYVLIEKIKLSRNRVDLAQLGGSDNAEPAISGGYLFKRDHAERFEPGFHTRRGVDFIYVDPKPPELTPRQGAWLNDYLNRFEQALDGPEFQDPERGYAAFLDVASFIDQHWLIEMTKNIDGFRYSAFLHKERGGKLQMGPAWDWNLSFGNANYHGGADPEGWHTPRLRETELCWFRRLSEDPEFAQRCIDRWHELRRDTFAPANVLGRVDALAAQLGQAQERNFRRWPILGRKVIPNHFVGRTYAEEIHWMKRWITARIAWIDRQFVSPPSFHTEPGSIVLRAPAGVIHYTLDGTDPRLPGGGISPKATAYTSPIPAGSKVHLVARAQHEGNWSGPITTP